MGEYTPYSCSTLAIAFAQISTHFILPIIVKFEDAYIYIYMVFATLSDYANSSYTWRSWKFKKIIFKDTVF